MIFYPTIGPLDDLFISIIVLTEFVCNGAVDWDGESECRAFALY